ncbi:YdcF family protein [Nocardia yamanashiensis]|uniref:SanA/YdcF family protein n=1 Tax=Nocardia yamanashiensis TaxID=209247 RepID=UPI001E4E86F1|nr:ElyC/SanA/YdcF family protein [Nocardia yamanashiensis]UGT45106.1 YdcF family protein [Nocardia yamanashiensis]
MQIRSAARAVRTRAAAWFPPRRVAKALGVAALIGFVVLLGCDLWIRSSTSDRQFSVESAPSSDVAIVLGAEVYASGEPSPYLAARLDLGRRLLAAGKVKAILVTGDNGRHSYDEPTSMRDYLIRRGVPAEKIALDYAGFSTYESCARAHDIFGVRSATVLTQDFSLPRTIALCRAVGIETVGVGDDTQPHEGVYRKIWLRDQLACTKAVYAIVFKPAPTFLGRQETTVRDAMAAAPR